MGKKPNEKKMTITGIILYCLIMLAIILIYRDFIMTLTCVTIAAVIIITYVVPRWREEKEQKEKDSADS